VCRKILSENAKAFPTKIPISPPQSLLNCVIIHLKTSPCVTKIGNGSQHGTLPTNRYTNTDVRFFQMAQRKTITEQYTLLGVNFGTGILDTNGQPLKDLTLGNYVNTKL
jgi:hypothetical protein